MTWQRKVQVYKDGESVEVEGFQVDPDPIDCELWIPPHTGGTDYKPLTYLSSRDS